MTPVEKINKIKSEIREIVQERRLDEIKYSRLINSLFAPGRHTIESLIQNITEIEKLQKQSTKQTKKLVELGNKLIRTYPECESLIIR